MPRVTKAEKAEEVKAVAAYEALIAQALRWTAPIAPDVPPPARGEGGLTTGYMYNTYGAVVVVACSSGYSHGVGSCTSTTTQGARALYSTRERALRALRAELERDCAKRLAGVDSAIEAAQRP